MKTLHTLTFLTPTGAGLFIMALLLHGVKFTDTLSGSTLITILNIGDALAAIGAIAFAVGALFQSLELMVLTYKKDKG